MSSPPIVDPSFDPPDKPLLPYAGTSGRGGSAASASTKGREDAGGTTRERQGRTLALLAAAGPVGMTYRDLGRSTGWHHGQSTGTLSVLHKEGLIARLGDVRRENCSVYVMSEFIDGRATKDYRPNRANRRAVPELTIDESILIHNLRILADKMKASARPGEPAYHYISIDFVAGVLAIVDRLTSEESEAE